MNYLLIYLTLRGLTIKQLSRRVGLYYTSVQKVVKGQRETPHVRAAVAQALDLEENRLFGPDSGRYLKGLIAAETKGKTPRRRKPRPREHRISNS